MRVPLIITICIFAAGFAAFATEPIPIVTSRWDWAAAKFYRDAENDLSKGDLEGAHRNVAEALRRAPTFWPILYTRAKVFTRERKWDLAMCDCNEVLRQYSAWVPAALLRAQINAHIGNYAAARKELDHVIGIEPRREFYGMAFDARAWFRATCPDESFRNPQGAIEDAKKACTITQSKEANPLDTLATAYAAAGDFGSAMRYDQQAMQAPDAGSMGRTLREHLALFKQNRRVTVP